MSITLEESYAHCRRLARRSASNFYFSFLLLPKAKRWAMCALYAFLRRTDDLGDSDAPLAERARLLEAWRRDLTDALAGNFRDPLLPALADAVEQFHIPHEYLFAVIDGVEMDLTGVTYQTFDDLEQYCYRVASVVGLACIHIWGFRSPAALWPARQCGLAFQMTNILRDLKEDFSHGRVYLPQADLRQFNYAPARLESAICDKPLRELMAFEIARTENFYREAGELPRWLEPDGRRIYGAMVATYHGLLDRIKQLDGDVLSARVGLSRWQKLRIASRWLLLPPAATGEPALETASR